MTLTIGSSTGILIITSLFVTQVVQTLALCCAIRPYKSQSINHNQ